MTSFPSNSRARRKLVSRYKESKNSVGFYGCVYFLHTQYVHHIINSTLKTFSPSLHVCDRRFLCEPHWQRPAGRLVATARVVFRDILRHFYLNLNGLPVTSTTRAKNVPVVSIQKAEILPLIRVYRFVQCFAVFTIRLKFLFNCSCQPKTTP